MRSGAAFTTSELPHDPEAASEGLPPCRPHPRCALAYTSCMRIRLPHGIARGLGLQSPLGGHAALLPPRSRPLGAVQRALLPHLLPAHTHMFGGLPLSHQNTLSRCLSLGVFGPSGRLSPCYCRRPRRIAFARPPARSSFPASQQRHTNSVRQLSHVYAARKFSVKRTTR